MLLQYRFTEQALGAEINDKDEREPVDNLPQVGGNGIRKADETQQLRKKNHKQGAEDGPLYVTDTADEQGADDEDTFIQRETGRVDIAHIRGVNDSRHACNGGGDEECPRLGGNGISAHGLNHQFVGLNGPQFPSIRGIMKVIEKKDDNHGQNYRNGKIGIYPGKLPDTENTDAGNAGDAVRTACDRCPVVQDCINNELESHCGQYEIVTFQLDGSVGNDEAEQSGHQRDNCDNSHQRNMELHQEEGSDICADAIESGLAHGQEVGHADGKIGAEHQQDVDVQHDNDMKDILHTLHHSLFITGNTLRPQEQESKQQGECDGVLPVGGEEKHREGLQYSQKQATQNTGIEPAGTANDHGHHRIDENRHPHIGIHAHIINRDATGKADEKAAGQEYDGESLLLVISQCLEKRFISAECTNLQSELCPAQENQKSRNGYDRYDYLI